MLPVRLEKVSKPVGPCLSDRVSNEEIRPLVENIVSRGRMSKSEGGLRIMKMRLQIYRD